MYICTQQVKLENSYGKHADKARWDAEAKAEVKRSAEEHVVVEAC